LPEWPNGGSCPDGSCGSACCNTYGPPGFKSRTSHMPF
jgi:hypothetical protein